MGFKELVRKIELIAKCERCNSGKFPVNSTTLENFDSLQHMIECPKCGVKYAFEYNSDSEKNEWFSDRPLTIVYQEPTPQEKIEEVTKTKDKTIQLLSELKVIQDELNKLNDPDKHVSSESYELFSGIVNETLDVKLTKESILDIDLDQLVEETLIDFEQHMEDQATAIRDEEDELEEIREQLREEE